MFALLADPGGALDEGGPGLAGSGAVRESPQGRELALALEQAVHRAIVTLGVLPTRRDEEI
jgi:hypothetical protein